MLKKRFIVFKYISRLIPKKSYNSAITLHNINSSDYKWLASLLDYLKKDYEFIDPNDIEEALIFKKNSKKKLLLTFDDGFSSCFDICQKILNPRKIKALFFIPTSFIDLKNKESFDFCQKHFYPNSVINQKYNREYDALSLDQILVMIKYGHIIGGHTLNHPNLALLNEDELFNEITLSANKLESILKSKLLFFAFPFGSLDSINSRSFLIAKKRFKYCFTNIRGGLSESPSKYFLYRQNIEPRMPISLINAILDGKLDWKYRSSRKRSKKLYSH
ncbi:polysaccharide deacetylase family protein [Prochlorococcus sp. AH-716-J21]|nr:polysaccharide deacetylase family protein [Prochlorococcus sp. AH-716-J21]